MIKGKIMRIILITFSFLLTNISFGQKSYKDSMETYLKKYVKEHEVVTGKDKELMSFFPVDEKYRITCQFERTPNSHGKFRPDKKKLQNIWYHSF
jgi:hypothetical protein